MTSLVAAVREYCETSCHRSWDKQATCLGCVFEKYSIRKPLPASPVKNYIVEKLAREWEENPSPRWTLLGAAWRLLRPFLGAA